MLVVSVVGGGKRKERKKVGGKEGGGRKAVYLYRLKDKPADSARCSLPK